MSKVFSTSAAQWASGCYSTQEYRYRFPLHLTKEENDKNMNDSHLNVSAWRTWQLAWCSNWSSSHKKLWQKEQRKILPPAQKSRGIIFTVSRVDGREMHQAEVPHRDPKLLGHTRCTLHQWGDMHRRGCSDISCRGIPRLHRSHTLPPCGQKSKWKIMFFSLF